ncbi:MAG: alpha/beta hydrolase [Faecalicoccus sp.]|nr:alpha/beta hydrolase [Faecalicoccus sp.]
MSIYAYKMRETFHEGDTIRDAGLHTPEDIERFDDLVYGPDPKWNRLDVYRPKEKRGKLPVILSIHGGGWVYGDKERYQYYCMRLAQNGFAVINYTYRLAPEFGYPAPLEDTNLVASWIMENQDEYGLDTHHIFGVGDSAGANTVGLYAAILTNEDYANCYAFSAPEGFMFCALGTFCGTYQVDLYNEEDEITLPLVAEYLQQGGTVVEMDRMNVLKHITKKFPPVFAATGTGDFLKIQIPPLAEALIRNEVAFDIRFYTSEQMELGHDFCCNVSLEKGQECLEDACEFFKKYCN